MSMSSAMGQAFNDVGRQKPVIQSQQIMNSGAYGGTVYEPFSNSTPSDQSYSPAKAPSGPRREQASGRNPGEVDPEGASDQSPIGEPWVMILFASAFAGVLAIRAHKKRIVQTETQNNETMKTSGKYLAITLLMLMVGVGNAWGGGQHNTNWQGNVFFLAPDNWNLSTNSNVQIGITRNTNVSNQGRTDFTGDMTPIGTTRLYYIYLNMDHRSWNQYEYIVFTANSTTWGSDNNIIVGTCAQYTTPYDYGVTNSEAPYLFIPNSEGNGATLTGYCNTSGSEYEDRWYDLVDKAQTIELYTNQSSSNTGGSVNIAGTYMSAANTTTATGNITSSTTNVSYNTLIGSTVTLTATAADGYHFAGWYENASGGTAISTNTTYSYTCKGEKTLYARFETLYNITVNAEYGTVTTPSPGNTVTPGCYTAASIAVTPDNGYYFTNWTCNNSNVTFENANSASTTITANGTATVTAHFAPRFAVIGADENDVYAGTGMPGWTDYTNTMDYVAANDYERTLTLKGNTRYKFRLRDKVKNQNLGFTSGSDITLNGGTCWLNAYTGDVFFTLNASDVVTFKAVSISDETYHIDLRVNTSDGYATYFTASFDSKTFFADGTTGTDDGGTVTAKDWKNFDLTSGQKAKAGKAVTYTAAPEKGYTLEGWYSDAACTTPYVHNGTTVVINDAAKTLALSSTSGVNTTVYAKFVETATTVSLFASPSSSGHIEVETATGVWTQAKNLPNAYHINVGVHTQYNIRAVVDLSGRFFEKWRVSAIDQDFYLGSNTEADYDEDHATTTIYGKGNGRATQLLYADFTELEKVYFRNVNQSTGNKLWENVYVYYDITYEENCAKSKATTDESYIQEMKEIDDSKVYWAYVPRAFTRQVGDNHNGQVAFSDHNFGNNSGAGYKFYQHEAIKWSRYTKSMDMCVPTQSEEETSYNSTKYYKSYWKKYYAYPGLLGGYYLKKHSGGEYSNAGTEYYFKIVRDNVIQTTYEIKDADVTHQFMIEGFNGIQYKTDDIEADESFPVTMSAPGGTPYFTLTPNMEGVYTFTIDQSEEKMKLTVHYPVEVGDYRIKHTYTDVSSKTSYSNAVKAATVAETDTVSLFLFKSAGSPTTTLQKCTSINASTKQPVWTDQNTTNLSGFNSLEKSGVYKIGLTITDNAVSNTPEIKKYDGHYYIRVKGANTRNHLTNGETKYGSGIGTKFTPFVKNSAFEDDYDHYWVDWFLASGDVGGGAQSITATIQNDFNPDLAGKVADGVSTLSSGANVRYGYDSESNTLSYQMITGAGSSVKIKNTQGAGNVEVLTASTPSETWTDAYSSEPSATDAQNWMYEFTARVKENCTATIKSSYNGDDVELATNKKLLGGAGSGTHYVDVIYDFKTNRLITAWRPNPSSNYQKSINLESNLMLVRTEDGSPTTLNLIVDPEDDSKEGSLNDITQIYTVMHFTRDAWDASSRTTTGGGYTDAFYWISLPYDCYVSEIFGLDKYGDQWVIQTYHGDYRAQKGWWAETESWWYDLDREDIMKANQGYVIRLTNLESSGNVFTAVGVNDAYLYFPSANATALNIGRLDESTTTTVPEHKCTIVRDSANHAGDPNYDRRFIDSNWNIIGSPCFNSAKISTTGWADGETTGQTVNYDGITSQLQFFYTWSVSANTPVYEVQDATDVAGFEFKATHAYFVQYAGDLTWIPYSSTPFVGFKAPAADRDVPSNQTIRLSLSQNEVEADATYISRMAEGATEGYDLNMDLSKVMNSRKANIYTLAGNYKMAGNCLPDTVSVVPVGVRTYAAGTYTFSIPEGTNGTGVVLVDNVTGTRTNLALTDYTVTLAKGTFDGRFSLELSPIANMPTDIDNVQSDNAKSAKVRKVMIDGMLYIIKDGKVFDARGNRVE